MSENLNQNDASSASPGGGVESSAPTSGPTGGDGGAGAGALDPAAAAPGGETGEVGESIAQGLQSVGNQFEQFANEPSLDNAIAIFGPMLIDLGLAIGGLIVLVMAAAFIGRWAQRIARVGLGRLRLEQTVVGFLSRAAKYAIWIIAIPIALELFGVETTSLAAVIGATGLAIGLAMQGSLSNIAAGLMLLILQPFKIDDWIELDDEFGIVRDIGIFYTHIDTFTNKRVVLPNSTVLGAKIEHFTANKSRRVDVPVGVAYGCDLGEARDALEGVAKEMSDSPSKGDEPAVHLTAFGASSIDFEVRVWCGSKDFLEKRTSTITKIHQALAKAGIEIPFPQRTLTFAEPLGMRRLDGGDERSENNGASRNGTHDDSREMSASGQAE